MANFHLSITCCHRGVLVMMLQPRMLLLPAVTALECHGAAMGQTWEKSWFST